VKATTGDVLASDGKRPDARRAGILFAFGSLLFLLLTTVAESIYPGFSMQNDAISDLAALGTSTTAIEETAILGLAICWMAGAYFLFRNTGRRGLMVLNVVPGAGYLLAGLSPENVNLAVHSAGALLAFPLGAVAVMLSCRLVRGPLRYLAVGLGALSLLATLMIFVGYRIAGPCGTCSGQSAYDQSLDKLALGLGGWESMIVYPVLIWLVAFGGYLMAKESEGPR
jgi:hypothetical membrane protein